MEGLEYNRITGFPTNVLERLERSLSQYMSRYATVKVGITGNPQQRFAKYHAEGWKRMVVKYETTSENFVNQMEDHFIKSRPALANTWIGTSHMANASRFFLYFVMM